MTIQDLLFIVTAIGLLIVAYSAISTTHHNNKR